jgi:rare lipoprotein A
MIIKAFFHSAIASVLFAAAACAKPACGMASHYGIGDGYHGRIAADGFRFDAYGLTTAHRWQPFGNKLRVTNPSNGRSVVVRVTDRGPFVPGRVLDLSYGAFRTIADPGQGVARVCFERI